MKSTTRVEKRVILMHWKARPGCPVEVFSNLKLLCQSYPQYNYNTLNNYLSKAKTAYENDTIKVERLPVFSRPLSSAPVSRSIKPVVNKQSLKAFDEKEQDLEYWLGRPAEERLAAVTFIISQSLIKGQRMDKTMVNIIKRDLTDRKEIQKKLPDKIVLKKKVPTKRKGDGL